jgi:hypothetical protein
MVCNQSVQEFLCKGGQNFKMVQANIVVQINIKSKYGCMLEQLQLFGELSSTRLTFIRSASMLFIPLSLIVSDISRTSACLTASQSTVSLAS